MNRAINFKAVRGLFVKTSLLSLALLGLLISSARAQAINEGFDNVENLFTSGGWARQNNSSPVGTTSWFQGGGTSQNPTFPSHSGAASSYIAANFNSTGNLGNISTWLFTPTRTLRNGDIITFYTRGTGNQYPDRLEVRLSTNGTSTNVGTTATSVGDFTTLLLTINPNLDVGVYPSQWTQFTITLSGLPAAGVSGRLAFRYFVTDGGAQADNSDYIGIDTFTYTPNVITATDAVLDYNGDNRTDYVVVRNTGGGGSGQLTWYVNDGTNHFSVPWGIASDDVVAGDFDGDNKDDLAVYRPAPAPNSFFYVLQSSNNTLLARELGTTGDDPTVVGDYDGDNKDDMAVYRDGASTGAQSFWYYRPSTAPNGIVTARWGQNGDVPVPGDFDGDGKNDFVVQRNVGGQGVFFLAEFDGGRETIYWGLPTDLVAPGDGKTDFAVVRASGGQYRWSVLGRNNNNIIYFDFPWGSSATDEITQGDYDGDGRTDPSVWRPNADPARNFFIFRRSTNGASQYVEWGQQNDIPVANYNVH
jgi:hypothetical protein